MFFQQNDFVLLLFHFVNAEQFVLLQLFVSTFSLTFCWDSLGGWSLSVCIFSCICLGGYRMLNLLPWLLLLYYSGISTEDRIVIRLETVSLNSRFEWLMV